MPFTCGLAVLFNRVFRPREPTLLPQRHEPLRDRVPRGLQPNVEPAPPISTGRVPPQLFAAAYMATSTQKNASEP